MKQFLILTVLMAIGCQNKEDMIVVEDLQRFYETKQNIAVGIDTIEIPEPPGPYYYSDNNFLFDEKGHTYYYTANVEYGNSCTPIQKTDFRPEFIGLKPELLIDISVTDFEKVVNEKIKPEYDREVFTLASVKDTFYSPEWSQLMKQLESQKDIVWLWQLRKMTQEERIVLEYKKSGKKYDPKGIAWDTTTIILPKAWKQ